MFVAQLRPMTPTPSPEFVTTYAEDVKCRQEFTS